MIMECKSSLSFALLLFIHTLYTRVQKPVLFNHIPSGVYPENQPSTSLTPDFDQVFTVFTQYSHASLNLIPIKTRNQRDQEIYIKNQDIYNYINPAVQFYSLSIPHVPLLKNMTIPDHISRPCPTL